EKVCYSKEQVITWLKNRFPKVDFSEVEKNLPPLIWRSRWNILADKYGLPFKQKYIQNLDSIGQGPASVKNAA
ncbi:hypothetical protein P6O83_15950, partial [Clostridium perfringens]|nr:hypothetical protein [Clostridium perfringens]